MLTLGSLLRDARLRAGLTQQQVVDRFSALHGEQDAIGQSYLSHIEARRRVPSLDVLRRLADIYGLDQSARGALLLASECAPDMPRRRRAVSRTTLPAA